MMESDGLSTTRVSIAPLPPSLPTELWLLIISSVERKEDLLTLCCTSKQLRALSLPYAFKVVKLGHDMTRTYGQLILVHESLRRLDVSSAISDFRIRIWEPKCRQGKGNLCSVCDKQDGLVGETLLALVNLEALEVTCQLCRTNSDTSGKRHSYIQQLRTRRLRTFKFHCRMCFGADLDQREKILASPCLETVQIFSYGPDSSYPIHEQASAFMARPGVLQGVHTMQFYGTTLDGQILATRPIQRLHVRYWHTIELDKASRLSQALSESPGKLTYLTVEAGLLRIIGVLPTFKFLRHVGTFDNTDISTLSRLKEHAHLDHLTSIDALAGVYLSQGRCFELKGLFPTLERVFLHGARCHIWELQGNRWVMRDAREFSAWDVIRGACDDL